MRALITGSSGFYGSHLCAELEANDYEVIKCDLREECDTIKLDIMNQEMISDVIVFYKPDVIINLAGQADVGMSWKKPQLTVALNTIGFINILETVKSVNPRIKIIAIGSSDEYGILKEKGENVTEDFPLKPVNPYAISKHAQEQFAQIYFKNYGLSICVVRQFNLGGAGQSKGFMISDFASGIAEIEAGKREFLSVGNLDSARDYTHVKDACRALRLIMERGLPGEVYNICSGETHGAMEILNTLISLSKVKISFVQESTKIRPSDTPVICGNHEKLTIHTGWVPELGLNDILSDSLNYWRRINNC